VRRASPSEIRDLVGPIPGPATRQAIERGRATGLLHLPYESVKDWELAEELDFLDGTDAITFAMERP
jgi:hypothetical protein